MSQNTGFKAQERHKKYRKHTAKWQTLILPYW